MEPQGLALMACFEGDRDAQLDIHRDDDFHDPMPVSHFFREPAEWDEIESAAVGLCCGWILDVGGGTGIHSLVLQESGRKVTAIDINPLAVTIMGRRGVVDARCADVFEFSEGPFDTLLLLGHGIGMVETIAGLDRFLDVAHDLTAEGGQILLDSADVRLTDNPAHLAYHEANRRAGRYVGEIRLRLGFRGRYGPICGWLHVDPETLASHAESAGWSCEVISQTEYGHFLARLKSH